MSIAIRFIIIAYIIVCIVVALIITIKKKRDPNINVRAEVEHYINFFFINLLASLLITPIAMGIYQALKKINDEKNRGYYE